MTNCYYCFIRKAQYTVIAPVCVGSFPAPLCPQCFQAGINEGAIVWLGPKAYGLCEETDCEHEVSA